MTEDEEIGIPETEQIAAIFAAAKKLNDELKAAIENKDVAAQRLLTVKLMRVELDFKRIETRKRLMLAMVMKGAQETKTPEERREKLLSAFEYTADVRKLAQDDLVDDDLSRDAETQLQTIISGLDALEPDGRKALAPFLDRFNLDTRVCAAVALVPLMPDRAIPILRDLAKNAPGTNAGETARATLDELSKRAE